MRVYFRGRPGGGVGRCRTPTQRVFNRGRAAAFPVRHAWRKGRALTVQCSDSPIAGVPTLSVVVPCYNERANVRPLVEKLGVALAGVAWEAIFVDDNSPDGTAAEVRRVGATDPHIRCLRRVGRRGLSSAVIEGALSAAGNFVAVMDGDLQHDETRLPAMLAALTGGDCDIVVGSRYVEGGGTECRPAPGRGGIACRRPGSGWRRRLLPVRLSDPMSGFFMVPRAVFERAAGQG